MDAVKQEVMASRPLLTEEDYWATINGLAINSLANAWALRELREYYETHDFEVLGDEAQNIILHWFGLTIY